MQLQLRGAAARFGALALLYVLLVAWAAPFLPPAQVAVPAPLAVQRDDRFGIAHISYGDGLRSDVRYQQAAEAGARWNRWAIYWHEVERSPGSFDYSTIDATVADDLQHGFRLDAILMGTPSFYATAGSAAVPPPRVEDKARARAYAQALRQELLPTTSSASSAPSNLYQPVFADGSDEVSPGKAINPANPWAVFVSNTVHRYKPGGTLGQQRGWAAEIGITHWEIWNEPDFSLFWQTGGGEVEKYLRLLKVAYLAIKAADPTARVMVGGMMYWEWANNTGIQFAWLKEFLRALKGDREAAANGHYFDIIPWHWYSRSSDLYYKTFGARQVLAQFGITGKEIWVNEANAPACGGSEPPLWIPCGDAGPGNASVDEQAAFVIQALAYGFAAGVERIFVFQLYDDGNDQGGFGLARNDGSPRPAYTSYQVMAQLAGGFFVTNRRLEDSVERIVFATLGAKVTVLWKNSPGYGAATVPAAAPQATLVDQDGSSQPIVARDDGTYWVPLEGATNNKNFNGDPTDYPIGGHPRLLVEELSPDADPPASAVEPLPSESSGGFIVRWSGTDYGWGIMSYDVQYRDAADTQWQGWLQGTAATSAIFYNGAAGHTYYFRSRATDYYGNQEPWPEGPGDAFTTVLSGIQGYVRDNRGVPIFGAAVSAGQHTTITDINGRYRLTVPDGWYDLSASKSGFGSPPIRKGVYVVNGAGPGVDFYLGPTTNVVHNGGFEETTAFDGAGWTPIGSTAPLISSSGSSGDRAVLLGQDFVAELGQSWGNSTIAQSTIVIPSTMYSPTLSFVYKLTTPQQALKDWFEVILVDSGDLAHPHYLIAPADRNPEAIEGLWTATDWTHISLALSSYPRDRPLTLIFNVVQWVDHVGATKVYLDEISIGPASGGQYRVHFPFVAGAIAGW